MATLKDVAKLACVDVSTVSRALNNTSYVHPETKKRIYEAVEILSYKPNLLAKGLRQGKRQTIGIVVPSISLNVFSEITQYIEIEARNLGYGVMICNTKDSPAQEEECLNRLRNGLVDGIIIASTGKNTRLIRDIKATGISVIQLIRTQDKSISSVVANYRQTAYSSCEYLIDKGCKKIGFINGNMQIIPFKERYLGYRESIKNHELKEYLVKSQTPRYDNFLDGYNGALNLIEKDVDAIITALDMQGLGAIRALKESDKKVPDEVKVISLTGHSIGAMLETKLTSLEIPVKKLAKVATEMLIEEISTDMKLKHKVLKAELIERETT